MVLWTHQVIASAKTFKSKGEKAGRPFPAGKGKRQPTTRWEQEMKKITIFLLALWAVTASAGTNEMKALPDMNTAKIPTGKAAEDAVIQKIVADPNDGLSSTHGPTAMLAFMLGFDVPDFGKRGDRVWQVHFVAIGGHTARIAWVNGETGRVMFLMEEKKKAPNKASDATSEPAPGAASSAH